MAAHSPCLGKDGQQISRLWQTTRAQEFVETAGTAGSLHDIRSDLKQVLKRSENSVLPVLGSLPISKITVSLMLSLRRRACGSRSRRL